MPEAPKPICFMIMPFGTKPTGVDDSSLPARINFDELWDKALEPAITKLGYLAVRADQDMGALIIQEMLERLTLADLVLADLTIPNGNVYYEVGVRHAAKQMGCVLTAADWARPLFDLNQMRQLRYPLSSEVVSELQAVAIRQVLEAGVPALAQADSPVFSLPGYPAVDLSRTLAFKSFVDELSAFQAEVRAVRHAARGERAGRVRALLEAVMGQERKRLEPMLPAVAVELLFLIRDYLGWKDTVEFVGRLPDDIRKTPVIREQYCLALSNSGEPLEAIGALEELVQLSGDSSERQGLLGGRYKRLYNQGPDPVDRKRYLQKAIQHYEQGMFLDLNDYYPSCNLPRLLRERGRQGDLERAQAVAQVVVAACERARRLQISDEWLNPTLLGAGFDAGDVVKARELLDLVEEEGPAAWKLDTTIADLERSAAQAQDEKTRQDLLEIIAKLRALL